MTTEKHRFIAIAILLAILLPCANLLAQERGFGLGIIVGEPTGLTGKNWLSPNTAFDFAAAWSLRENNSLTLQADYLMHSFNLIRVDKGQLPFYYGIGGRIRFADRGDDDLGVRIPLGLNYHFQNISLDAFFELVPVLDLAPETDFEVDVAIGVRFFFN